MAFVLNSATILCWQYGTESHEGSTEHQICKADGTVQMQPHLDSSGAKANSLAL